MRRHKDKVDKSHFGKFELVTLTGPRMHAEFNGNNDEPKWAVVNRENGAVSEAHFDLVPNQKPVFAHFSLHPTHIHPGVICNLILFFLTPLET